MADIEPIGEATDRRCDENADDSGGQDRMLPQAVANRRLTRICIGLGRRFGLMSLIRSALG
jgi:hypothetical protein